MNLEDMLSERIQTPKDHVIWCHLYEMSNIGKSIEKGSRLVVARGLGERGNWEWLLIGMGFFLGDENVLKLDNGDSCTTL